jgi:hypothetical protein
MVSAVGSASAAPSVAPAANMGRHARATNNPNTNNRFMETSFMTIVLSQCDSILSLPQNKQKARKN